MEGSLFASQYVQTPVRSISLPSRSHPSSLKIEAELTELRSWNSSSASTASPLESETIHTRLIKFAELFNSIEDLIHSPLITQQASHHHHSNKLEEMLDGSVGLLDICSSTRDLLLAVKEHVQDLQSALRRRGEDLSIQRNLHAYISFRKKARKDIGKSLAALKRTEAHFGSLPLYDGNDRNLPFVINVTREASAITISLFRSCLLFFYQSAQTTGGWSLVSKLIRSGILGSDKGQKIFNEMESADIAICSMYGQIRKNDASKIDLKELQTRLETLDVTISGFESKFDRLFRCLIQHSVSLLNLVTP